MRPLVARPQLHAPKRPRRRRRARKNFRLDLLKLHISFDARDRRTATPGLGALSRAKSSPLFPRSITRFVPPKAVDRPVSGLRLIVQTGRLDRPHPQRQPVIERAESELGECVGRIALCASIPRAFSE